MHYGLLRGETTRFMEHADLFYHEFPVNFDLADQMIPSLCFLMDRGKTNQCGKIEYGCAVRARDVHTCCIGALALHYFDYFTIKGNSFPNVCHPKEWYGQWVGFFKIAYKICSCLKGKEGTKTVRFNLYRMMHKTIL